MSFIVSSILRFSMFRLKKEKREKSVVDMYSPFPHVFGFWVEERKLRKKNLGKWRNLQISEICTGHRIFAF